MANWIRMERKWQWLVGLVIIVGLPQIIWALDASPAFTAVTDQGRPMVGATLTVVDSVGAPVTACNNPACTVAQTTVPASGIVQFWAAEGTYTVTLAGAGITRIYTVVIPSAAVTGAITDADFPGNYNSFMRRTSIAGVYGQTKINTAAAVDPTVDDDVSLNYNVGSLWVNTLTDDVFLCGSPVDGAAVWRKVGTANVDDGNADNDTLFWNGSSWVPGDWLQVGPTFAAVGDTGRLITASTFQIGQDNASTTFDIYSKVAAVILDTVIGQIRFGSTDSSIVPREAAFIKARALNTWLSGSTSAPTSLDFQVQDTGGSSLGDKIFRIQPDLVMVGSDVPDGSLQGQARFVTEGISIADLTGMKSTVFLTPAALDVTVKEYTLPDDSGTAGYYLRTDGNSLFPTLSWEPIAAAPGNFAVTGQETVTAGLVSAPSYSFIGDTNTGFTSLAGTPCIVDEGINGVCLTGNGANSFTSIAGALNVATGVTSNNSFTVVSIGGSGQEIAVNVNEFIVDDGEVSFTGVSGDGTGKATCVKADGYIGTCSDAPNGSGVCTCG